VKLGSIMVTPVKLFYRNVQKMEDYRGVFNVSEVDFRMASYSWL